MPMSPRVRLEWQAGKYVRLEEMGRWWAAVPPEARPAAHQSSIQEDFEGEWGDRRQELVFIGTRLDTAAIEAALDECLCTDEEMDAYRRMWKDEVAQLQDELTPAELREADTFDLLPPGSGTVVIFRPPAAGMLTVVPEGSKSNVSTSRNTVNSSDCRSF